MGYHDVTTGDKRGEETGITLCGEELYRITAALKRGAEAEAYIAKNEKSLREIYGWKRWKKGRKRAT